MKVAALVISCFLGSAFAAPAIVWSKSKEASQAVVHSSKSVKASSLLGSVVDGPSNESSLAATIFLLGRAPDGSDSLSGLASSGALPLVAAKYEDATAFHSHVAGVESAYTVTRDAGANTDNRVLEVSLSEFSSKVTQLGQAPEMTELDVDENGMINKATKHANLREKALAEANYLIVNIPASTDPSAIDAAVVQAIEHESIGSVVLAGLRSHDEVKHERVLLSRRNTALMMQHTGRRLADQANDADAEADDDTTGVYYVHMTPNIFAGIMFFFLFSFVIYTGVSCMGMIAGQDVYVTKMPTIGREA